MQFLLKTSFIFRFSSETKRNICRSIESLSRWMLNFTINHLISSIRVPIDQLQLISYLLRIGNEEKNSFVNSPIDVLCPRFRVFPFFSKQFSCVRLNCSDFSITAHVFIRFQTCFFFFVFDFVNWWLSLFHSVRANDKTWNFTEKKTKSYQSFIVRDRRIFGFELIFR